MLPATPSPERTVVHRAALALASPLWMLAFFAFAFAGALTSIYFPEWVTTAWIPPLGVFSLSLLAAVATNPRFRRDWSLLGLHLGLLALVALVAVSRLTYFDGAVTLTRGEEFDGRLLVDRRGPLHRGGVERLRFANEGFVEEYIPGQRWKTTQARLRWRDEQARERVAVIDNDRPLLLDGYRIYSTFNRGYAPVIAWAPHGGSEEIGAVQLRPGEGFSLGAEWQLPAGPRVWALLELPPVRDLTPGERRANLGEIGLDHKLVLRIGDRRHVFRPGETVELPQGRLRYVRLDSWMGYRVVYDVAMYWMLSAAMIVVVCMIVYYARLLLRSQECLDVARETRTLDTNRCL